MNLKKFMTADLDLPTIEKTIKLAEDLLLKTQSDSELDQDAKAAWKLELTESKQRLEELRNIYVADTTHETTHKDRCVMLIQFDLAQAYLNIVEKRKQS